jgi:isochorismate synthase EntC
MISDLEPYGRGWYGGAVGWADGRGQGDLSVAIRGALVREREVTIYAGAGIVAGSDPDSEVEEIELKIDGTLASVGLA